MVYQQPANLMTRWLEEDNETYYLFWRVLPTSTLPILFPLGAKRSRLERARRGPCAGDDSFPGLPLPHEVAPHRDTRASRLSDPLPRGARAFSDGHARVRVGQSIGGSILHHHRQSGECNGGMFRVRRVFEMRFRSQRCYFFSYAP